MKNTILASILFFILFSSVTYSTNNDSVPVKKIFSTEDIRKIAGKYVNNNLHLNNPAIVDVDGDGAFDLLIFNDGNVAYYRNTGTLEEPFFVLENPHYDKYTSAFFLKTSMPYPLFFADKNGDGKMDLFAVTDKIADPVTHQYNYKIWSAENTMDLDTGTLITIILVLVIVLLVLAIVH